MPKVSVTNEKGVSYYLIESEKYVRVTTPLSIASLPYIELWKMRVGKTKAELIAKKAANYGSKIHGYCDRVCQGEEFEVAEKYKADIDAFRKWYKNNVEEIIATEKVVWSKKYQLAGRYDILAKLKGYKGLCLLDIKTGRIKPEHFLQLAAYRVLIAETEGISKSKIKHRLIIGIKNGKVKVIPSDKKQPKEDINIDNDWEVYLNFLNIWHWSHKNK